MAKESARKNDDESLDYEIVDETDKSRRKDRDDDDDRPRRKERDDGGPKSRHRDDDDDRPRRKNRDADADDDDRPRSKPKRKEEDDDRPRSKKHNDDDDEPKSKKKRDNDDERLDAEDEDDEERPRKKKKKKKKKKYENQSVYDDLENRSHISIDDWMIAGFLFATGFVLCLVAAVGIAGSAHAWKALFVMFVYFLLLLPITIGAMMGVGIVMGIDYGEYKVAILKLAAISAFNNGLIWLGDWIGLPFYLTLSFCALIGFGLFMTVFELDPQEATTTIGAINLVQFAARFILVAMAILKARHEDRKDRDRDYDDDRPKINKKIDEDFGKGKIQMPVEDDDDGRFPP